MLNLRFLKWLFYGILVACLVYLCFVDYSSKLETDVSSMLNDFESPEASVIRNLVGERQGRLIYLELSGLPPQTEVAADLFERLLAQLRAHSLVESTEALGGSAQLEALSIINRNPFVLLFPGWLSEKTEAFNSTGLEEQDFPAWAADVAVDELEAFLEQPEAMELGQPALLDPLLLKIDALVQLMDSGGGAPIQPAPGFEDKRYAWVILGASGLIPEVQDAVAALMQDATSEIQDTHPGVRLEYGGLVKLARASRERIQGDVFKINSLSLLGVIAVAFLFLRKPLVLAWVLPVIAAGVIGAVTAVFLLFETVNVIALIVGSILVGTSIDYAIHLLFAQHARDSFPVERLVGIACVSTVAGFFVLLLADLSLIRQIGVFVGSGLLCSFFMARLSGISRLANGTEGMRLLPLCRGLAPVFPLLAFFCLLAGVAGLLQLEWKDDIRNLEAPDSELVQDDLDLRVRLGMSSQQQVFLTTGESFLDVLELEAFFFDKLPRDLVGADAFGFSNYLPKDGEVASLKAWADRLPAFFNRLEQSLTEQGYDVGHFRDFFTKAQIFSQEESTWEKQIDERIEAFADSLTGPLAGALGRDNSLFWSLSFIQCSPESATTLVRGNQSTTLFSQLHFLNSTLNQHRKELASYGIAAALVVAVMVLVIVGLSQGILTLLFPLLGCLSALGLSSLWLGSLNMFNLIGCLLGSAIALDYALFSVEAFKRGEPIPFSVWLSAATTTASFLALSFSSIPVVRALGTTVALIIGLTLLFIFSARNQFPILTRAKPHE